MERLPDHDDDFIRAIACGRCGANWTRGEPTYIYLGLVGEHELPASAPVAGSRLYGRSSSSLRLVVTLSPTTKTSPRAV